MKKKIFLLVCLLCSSIYSISASGEKESKTEFLTQAFIHPGMAQSKQDLDYMREMVLKGIQPWKKAYENLKKSASLDFIPSPCTEISVGPYGANSIGGREFSESAEMAYNHALMWYITKDRAYAQKTIEILNAWSYLLRGFDANNAKLNVGLFGYYYLNAAEILKYTDSGWTSKDLQQFTQMVLTVFYPTIKDFFTEANGNWDASMISTIMCIGIFTDNHDIFNRAIERFYWGEGNSGITRYLYPGGQCQETTRDWGHVQLGIGEFAKAAQTANTQGLDFYSVADDRLAQGFEYTARFMLGEHIDLFGVFTDRDNDKFRDIYESIYHHYKNVRGVILPYTEKAIKEHTRSKSSVGFLTAVKAPISNVSTQPSIFTGSDNFLKPTIIGALKGKSKQLPANSIHLKPGESIQEAINSNRNTGKWIILEAGVHTLDAPLKIYSGTLLAGKGRETIIFPSPRTETAIINGEDILSDVTIRDLLVEGATKVIENADPNHDRRSRSYMNAPSREGIILKSKGKDGIQNVVLENITVQNFTKNGVAIVSGKNIRIHQCDFSDNGASVVPGAGFHHNLHLSYITNCEITSSRFDTSPYGNGINVTFCMNVKATHSEMARNGLSGIRCAESSQIAIINSLAEGNGENGIFIEKQMNNCKDITIHHNTVQNNRCYGIDARTAIQPSIKDNISRHNYKE